MTSIIEGGAISNLHAAFPTPGGANSNRISPDLVSAVNTPPVTMPREQVEVVACASKQCAFPNASQTGVSPRHESLFLMYAHIDLALR